jgi:hypothetical protein
VTVSGTPPSPNYTTNFDQTENPLSEGRWIQQDALQTFVKTVGGAAYGTQSGGPNGPYDDSSAQISGFGNNYEIEGTIVKAGGLDNVNREVELLLRWSGNNPVRPTPYGNTHSNGYEINVQHAGQYMQLGRYKGALLVQVDNYAIPKTGDRFRARIEGQRVRVWWNDVIKIDYTDNDATLKITTGDPGIGFFINVGPPRPANTDFGFDSITVRGL